jgi:putative Mg2+ transporter-C (MgtC) family protein
MNIWNLILRLLVAGLLGGAIGLERNYRAKEAGFRTHFLVALGSALFMLISQYGFTGAERFDAARVAAQVVSGIGFLGAGIIIFQKNAVRGLTTAAGLWVASAIGLGCGAGLFALAGAAAVLALVCLEAMHYITLYHGAKTHEIVFTTDSEEKARAILQRLGKEVENESLTFENGLWRIRLTLITRGHDSLPQLLDRFPGVTVESIN